MLWLRRRRHLWIQTMTWPTIHIWKRVPLHQATLRALRCMVCREAALPQTRAKKPAKTPSARQLHFLRFLSWKVHQECHIKVREALVTLLRMYCRSKKMVMVIPLIDNHFVTPPLPIPMMHGSLVQEITGVIQAPLTLILWSRITKIRSCGNYEINGIFFYCFKWNECAIVVFYFLLILISVASWMPCTGQMAGPGSIIFVSKMGLLGPAVHHVHRGSYALSFLHNRQHPWS